MAFYVTLSNFTDQGVKAIKDPPKRAEAFKALAAKSGVKVHSLMLTTIRSPASLPLKLGRFT